MSAYFNLELDTTPPELTIYMPTYTIIGIDNEIRIISNDELSSFQEIYFIDAYGERHDMIFNMVSEYELIGIVDFNSFPTGIAEFNAILKDEVLNKSALYKEAINIMLGADVNVRLNKNSRKIKSRNNSRKINSLLETRRIINKAYDRNIDVDSNTRNMDTKIISHIDGRG